jgi:hypothetical protein
MRIRQQADMKQIMECILPEMKANQEEMMAKVGAEMKADMKTQMVEMKTNQESLEAKIKASNMKFEALQRYMWTTQEEIKSTISVFAFRWMSTWMRWRPGTN